MPYKDKKQQYESMQRSRESNQRKMVEYLLEHSCVDCGESDIVVLDFDHINGEKKFLVGRAVSSSTRSWKTILVEIEKCVVRCANCHRKRHAKERSIYKYIPSNNT